MVNTGIYIRVSTEEQAKEGFSIRAQEEKLKSYAAIKEWQIYGIYTDEGISGKDIEGRPAIKRLIEDITKGKVNNVLIYKIDRLTRSTKNLIELIELFNQYRCAFNSLNESIDTSSATGRMFLKIVGIFAEFERENLAERVRMGRERKVREGYSICSWTQSYGYTRELGQRNQEILPDEAAIVRRIFDMYLKGGYSLKQIAKTLNAENVPTKKNTRWLGCTIKVILMNPTYLGKVRYSMTDPTKYFETEGQHEAIIDDRTFYQVQEKLGLFKKIARTKRPSSAVYFLGVLYCGVCGGRMTTKWNYIKQMADGSKKQYPNYICSNVIRGLCSTGTIAHSKVERVFETYLLQCEDFTETDNIDLPAVQTPFDRTSEINVLAAELKQVDIKNEEIMSLFVANSIDFSNYQRMLKMNNERRGELELRLKLIESEINANEKNYNSTEIMSDLIGNWSALTNEQCQEFVCKFIKKIVVRRLPYERKKLNNTFIDEVEFNEF